MRGFRGMMGDGDLYAIRWLAPVSTVLVMFLEALEYFEVLIHV